MLMRTALLTVTTIATLAACGKDGGESPVSQPKPIVEDERGSVGPGSPAAGYCEKLGYRTEGDACVFPDGTRCEQWSFYRAECGHEHS